ncbi:hypothetical protein [Streptomyces sp. TRM70350]|uniref:hypothetical protein n=1 Tax=Streptomyces sp. TRM70350 TaxID=2856165 RepID=UPI001C453C8A|nr:hypothetical protein [Streptomyces sp. TRM70350]MBV7699986.1 hypothetical protein [Streptomyces sp. TRM70350]
MSTDSGWEYDPDHAHVAGGIGGIPVRVVADRERLADQLVDLASTGIDVSDLGNGAPDRAVCPVWTQLAAGPASVPLPGTPRDPLISVVRIVPRFDSL